MFAVSIFKTRTGGDRQAELGPEETIEAFYSSLCKGEFEMARGMCDTLAMAEYLEGFMGAWKESDSTVCLIAADILSEVTVTVTDTQKSGQSRTVFYELSAVDGSNKEKTATLSKEEGAWKIEEITDRL